MTIGIITINLGHNFASYFITWCEVVDFNAIVFFPHRKLCFSVVKILQKFYTVCLMVVNQKTDGTLERLFLRIYTIYWKNCVISSSFQTTTTFRDTLHIYHNIYMVFLCYFLRVKAKHLACCILCLLFWCSWMLYLITVYIFQNNVFFISIHLSIHFCILINQKTFYFQIMSHLFRYTNCTLPTYTKHLSQNINILRYLVLTKL